VAQNGAAAAEPTHILADRAELEHATDIATFFGKPARMWQGGNQVQAPVLEFSHGLERLIARGEGSTGWSTAMQAAQVHTVLVNAGSDGPGAASGGTGGPAAARPGAVATAPAAGSTRPDGRSGAARTGAGAGAPDVVRIASGGLVYSGTLRQADFTGGAFAQTVDGTIRAREAMVTLSANGAPGPAANGAAAAPSMAGSLERVVATGGVEIEQPGFHATGERLVYTESDGLYELTGDKDAPPKAMDADGTTTTGRQ
jgi:lipopolysaccharide export system protein LptA